MRVFIAFRLEDDIRTEIARAQRALRKAVPYGISFTAPEQLSLTLRFIPDASQKQVPKIIQAMQQIAGKLPPFELAIDCCQCFPPHGLLSTIWAIADQDSEAPISLAHQLLDEAARNLGFEIEEKPYVPHITFARIRRNIPHQVLRQEVSKIKLTPLRQRVESLTLFQSDLTIKGSVHTELHTEPLTAQLKA